MAVFASFAQIVILPLLQGPSYIRRFAPLIFLTLLGIGLAAFLIPREIHELQDHLTGFPDANRKAHELRAVVLGILCFLPALGALYYCLSKATDRYLIRQFMGAFCLCFTSLFAIWFISDLSNHYEDFNESEDSYQLMASYYLAAFPRFFVDYAPYGLLLAMLLSLGKLSKGQEIIAIIQTGRGIASLIMPLILMGGLVGLVCLGFNYRWAPVAGAYQNALLQKAENGALSKARNVVYYSESNQRLWLVGSFPFQYHRGEPLENVIIRSFSPDGQPISRLNAKTAQWDRETNDWIFSGVGRWDMTPKIQGHRSPKYERDLPDPLIVKGWTETPWQLIKPGLKAEELGIPGLHTWLSHNRDSEWTNKRRFLTQWHYRWAQPGICFAIVLLAAPLGIVFTRRGAAGGVAVAIFLCIGMLFTSTIFLALGESGYLPPVWAAWGTNILSFILAMYLIQCRLVGRPIYQSLRKLLPS